MPTIPSLERRTVTPSSRVTNVGVADIGSVGRELGGAIDRTRARIDEAAQKKTRYELADAKSKFGILMHQQNNAYEQDNDYATIPQRWGEKVRSGADELLAGVSDLEARNMLRMEISERIAASEPHITQLAFGKERELDRANVFSQMEANREVYLGKDPVLAKNAAFDTKELLQASVDKGAFTQEVADEAYRTWKEDAAVGRLNMFDPEDQLLALDDPLIKDNLKSDTMAKLRRGVEDKVLDKKARAIVDGLGDFSLSRLYDAAYDIEDYDLSQKVKSYGESVANDRRMAKMENAEKFYDQRIIPILRGDEELDTNSSEFLALPASQKVSLYRASQASKAPVQRSNIWTVDKLNGFIRKGDFVSLRDYLIKPDESNGGKIPLEQLSPAHQMFYSKISWRGEVPDELKIPLTMTQLIASEVGAGTKNEDVITKNEITRHMTEWMQLQVETGAKTNQKDMIEEIRKAAAKVQLDPSAFFWLDDKEEKRYYQLNEDERGTLINETLSHSTNVSDLQLNIVMRDVLENPTNDTITEVLRVGLTEPRRLNVRVQDMLAKKIMYELDPDTSVNIINEVINKTKRTPTAIQFLEIYERARKRKPR